MYKIQFSTHMKDYKKKKKKKSERTERKTGLKPTSNAFRL